MKANELMIGDWVYGCTDPYDKDEEQKKYPVKVIKIDIDGDTWTIGNNPFTEPYEDEWWNIEPIPLTPEILEKNGFVNISNHTLKGGNTFRLDIEQRGYDYCVTIKPRDYFKLQSYDDRWYTLCEMEFGCNYVHELQHALRLCGIEKEIVL